MITKSGKAFDLEEYGEILVWGKGEEPNLTVQKRMSQHYAFSSDYEQQLLDRLDRIKNGRSKRFNNGTTARKDTQNSIESDEGIDQVEERKMLEIGSSQDAPEITKLLSQAKEIRLPYFWSKIAVFFENEKMYRKASLARRNELVSATDLEVQVDNEFWEVVNGPWEQILTEQVQKAAYLIFLRAANFAENGDLKEVERCAAKLQELGGPNNTYNAAVAYSWCVQILAKQHKEVDNLEDGQRIQKAVFRCLEEALEANGDTVNRLANDPDFLHIRELAEFKNILKRHKTK